MYRTRFKKDIVAEFLPPEKKSKTERLIILCDGMPSIPKKQPLAEFLSKKGYWVVYPRYRGAWESGGVFLEEPPHLDIRDIIDEVMENKKMIETAFYQSFAVSPDEIFVIGGSFGGAAALMASLDHRVKKVIANCPVVDWNLLKNEEKLETANSSYADYLRDSFGNAYRLPEKNWQKLYTGTFYNPANHIGEFNPGKIRIFHAKDDPFIPAELVKDFCGKAGIRLKMLRKGGHLRTEFIIDRYWNEIHKFFIS